jgi:hypothetical protein
MTISIEEGESRVHKLADARKSKSLARRQVLKQFEQGLESFNRAHEEVRRSVRSRIDVCDEHGSISTEIVPGVPNGLRSGVCLVATNVRAIRVRVQALTSAINKIERVIQSIQRRRWDEVPDPAVYLESLWMTIPPAGDDELKVIAAPAEPTDMGDPQPEEEKGSNAV